MFEEVYCFLVSAMLYFVLFVICAGMSELADEADSKSVGGNVVWVQVPLPA